MGMTGLEDSVIDLYHKAVFAHLEKPEDAKLKRLMEALGKIVESFFEEIDLPKTTENDYSGYNNEES